MFGRPVYNGPSYVAQNNLNITQRGLGRSIERLSSGLRINRAGDDAANLGVSEGMRAQIRGKKQAIRNSNDGIGLIQTAEGGLDATHKILQRMRELAVQSANGVYNDATDRAAMDTEFQQLALEITRIANTTKFNNIALGNAAGTVTIQCGSDTTANDVITIATTDCTATGLGVNALAVTTQANASTAMTTIDTALATVSTRRASFGAKQNRLEYTVENLGVITANLSESESVLRNVDIAEETANLTRWQVLQQSGTIVLQQSNQLSYSSLTLLRNGS